jgi:HSP20 family protein
MRPAGTIVALKNFQKGGENMQTQKAIQTSNRDAPPVPIFVQAENLFELAQEFTQQIARRAYEFFDVRGRQLGHELEDWFRAEAEVLRPIPIELKELDDQLIVCAEVPGFKNDEIKISAEPRRLYIEGSTETRKDETSARVVFNERRSNQFFRSVTLPADVDSANVTASLKDGVLEISLPKLPAAQATTIEVKSS